jgi:hypothetical protein
MHIEIPSDVEVVLAAKAREAGFEDIGEYVVSRLLEETHGESPHEGSRDNGSSDASSVEWSEQKNARRCELMDRDIQGELSAEERFEMANLTRQLREYRRIHAPLPIAGALKLHAELLEKKRRHEKGGER